MATNILNITAADSGKTFPLRGDMGVALNFTPADNHFRVAFVTQDAGTFLIGSGPRMFRALNAAPQSSLSVGGKVGLFIELMYDTDKNEFVVTKNNLVAGEAAAGGGTGTAATITVAQTVTGAPGTAALVENIGTAGAVQLKFTIPRGDPGAAGTGTGGTTYGIPTGGAAGQVLGKTGAADYAVGWVTPQASSGAGGAANTSEVVITPDANGNVELNAALGNRFRLVLTRAVKILNPVGFTGAAEITLVVVVGPSGAFAVTWDTLWAFSDSQPPGFATAIGGINLVKANLTDGDTWITRTFPDKSITAGFGKISPIARIGATQYYMLANAAGTGAFNNLQPGNTVVIQRSGKAAEATGSIAVFNNTSYTVAGAPIASSGEKRPLLQMMKTDYSEGPPRGANRPSFGKQILGAEGGGDTVGTGVTIEFRDLRITGGRSDDGDCRGIGQNGQSVVVIRNVDITDCNNGILTDNLTKTPLTVIDCLVDANGVGTPNSNANQGFNSTGYVHNIYTGHNAQTFTALRTSFTNSLTGHDIKTRCATTILDQVYAGGSVTGREIDIPNGGVVRATNCTFEKFANATQNNLIAIGNTFDASPGSQEGIDTSRPREYIFRNCRFINPINGSRDTSFLATKDLDVAVQFIDCEFIGAETLAKTTTGPFTADPNYAGMQLTKGVYHMPGKPPVWTLTGGPVGPILPAGKPSNVAMTPVA